MLTFISAGLRPAQDEFLEPRIKSVLKREYLWHPPSPIFRLAFRETAFPSEASKLREHKTLPKWKMDGVVHLDSPCGK